ncbi:zinc ribbon domain-containing protein [Caloranaerobacter azorensis]|uniref:C4-type zinc ribbon domain-containing protein n=3 Tax=Caloranaerobacter azorensis TaxID=116090 RepID=A0A1M5S9Q4_9FIRM|nr:C4-type zinc ribbon domain-containing protein [Caloranaerobacter azorensis]KGG79486.1 hypothetical protein Y919_11730 [Caloranaerobacter azorensis H53214]QIB26289.1 hypothetical protein G3A45_02555 [Caloranaerobacter azorensis]SHH35170.1 C4-type zinc ribbon domain-containing protein [Caloranaerobacter azorensis DSM 13643]
MVQLELLWQLQKHYLELNRLERKLKDLNKRDEIEEFKVKIHQYEYDLENKKTRLEVNNMKINRYNSKVNQLKYEFKEIENKLYSGKIKDIKQLTYMESESKKIKEEIEKLETEIILLMEEIDKLRNEIIEVEKTYDELKKNLEQIIIDNDSLMQKVELDIKKEKEIIDRISADIDEVSLKKFNKLLKNKGRAVVEVEGDKCTGCYMVVPLSILSKLKYSDSITYCDNCGRILYYKKQEE